MQLGVGIIIGGGGEGSSVLIELCWYSYSILMLEEGCDIYTLSKMMGYFKITTTTIYLQCSKAQMSKSIEMYVLN